MDWPQKDAAPEQEAPAPESLHFWVSGGAPPEEYPLMMFCVMDVMGPGCSAAWWQARPLATFEDKLAVRCFYSPSPCWIFVVMLGLLLFWTALSLGTTCTVLSSLFSFLGVQLQDSLLT